MILEIIGEREGEETIDGFAPMSLDWNERQGLSEDALKFICLGAVEGFHQRILSMAERMAKTESTFDGMVEVEGGGEMMQECLINLAVTSFRFGWELQRQYGSATDMSGVDAS